MKLILIVIVVCLSIVMEKRTSPPTPAATRIFAAKEPNLPRQESYGGWTYASVASTINPNTMSRPQAIAHLSLDDSERSKSLSLALLIPPGRRHAGNAVPIWVFWLVVALGISTLPLFIWLNQISK